MDELNIIAFGLDDEPIWLKFIEIALESSGVTSYKLFSKVDTMLQEVNESVNICIIDYHVPPYGGDEIIEFILTKSPLCLIIMVSNETRLEKVIETFHKGLYRFIDKTKKGTVQELTGYIEQAIKKIHGFKETFKRFEELQSKMNKTKSRIDELHNNMLASG